jgi:hypothetical protein
MPPCLTPFSHPLLQACFQVGQTLGCQLVLVGGAVRDALLGLPLSDDLDFVVLNGDCRQLADGMAQGLAQPLGLTRLPRPVLLDADWGIVRLVVWYGDNSYTVDLANALDNDLTTDLNRRDVTLNAIGWTGKQFADPTGGRRDLAQRQVRQINPQNFADDPLRVLRVFRTAACLPRARITPDTLSSCHTYAPGLARVAKERMLTEWLKLLKAPVDQLMDLLQLMPPAVLGQFVSPSRARVINRLSQWHTVQAAWLTALLDGTHGPLHGHAAQSWLTWLVMDAQGVRQYPVSRQVARLCQQWPEVAQAINPFMFELTPQQVAQWQAWSVAVPGALMLWGWAHPEMNIDDLKPYADAWHTFCLLDKTTPPMIDGQVIIQQWGVPAGPAVQQALQTVRQAQLAGLIKNPLEAFAYWQNHVVTGQY